MAAKCHRVSSLLLSRGGDAFTLNHVRSRSWHIGCIDNARRHFWLALVASARCHAHALEPCSNGRAHRSSLSSWQGRPPRALPCEQVAGSGGDSSMRRLLSILGGPYQRLVTRHEPVLLWQGAAWRPPFRFVRLRFLLGRTNGGIGDEFSYMYKRHWPLAHAIPPKISGCASQKGRRARRTGAAPAQRNRGFSTQAPGPGRNKGCQGQIIAPPRLTTDSYSRGRPRA